MPSKLPPGVLDDLQRGVGHVGAVKHANFQGRAETVKPLGPDGQQDRQGAAQGLGRADGAELPLVAREGDGRRAVAVRVVRVQAGQAVHAQVDQALAGNFLVHPLG